jgi:hypothetical protein
MSFQDGGYFGFKVIELENDTGDPPILFHKMISFSILNYFNNFKKILLSQVWLFLIILLWLNRIFFKLLK